MTKSYVHVLQNVSFSKLLGTASLLSGSLALITCFGLWLVHFGFDQGFEISNQACACDEIGISFSPIGPRTYEFLAYKYEYITIYLFVFLVAELLRGLFRSEHLGLVIVSRIVGLSSLVLAVHQIYWLFAEKSLRSQTQFWYEPYDNLLRNSVPYDCFIAIITGGLLLMQVASMLIIQIEKRRSVTKDFT